jgi:hypothetical protein
MRVVIPKDKGPNHGLHRSASGTYYVRWEEGGKQRTKTLGTKDAKTARKDRDTFYTSLEDKGAMRVGSPELALVCDRYIYRRPPYLVKVPGHKIHEVEDIAAAKAIRNELLRRKTR